MNVATAPPKACAVVDVEPPQRAQAAVALYASLLGATSLKAGSHRLVSALASDFGLDRASIGLHEGGRTRLLACTGLDARKPQADLPQCLLGAMDEALEQAVSLSWPLVDAASAAASDRILLEHRTLQRRVGGAVACVPLGLAGEGFAVVCVERHGGPPFTGDDLARLEQLLVLVAPTLRWMQIGTQPWHRRAWRELLQHWAALRQPENRTRRRLLAVGAAGLLFVALAPLEHDIGGRARIEGAEQRVIAAPTDGFVRTVHVRPGDRVKAGDPLVDLLEADLRLERDRWNSQLAQHENAYASAMAKADRVVASTSMARIGEAQAQLALVDEQLARGRITAPFDALVIQGDMSQSIGAPVRQGDTLMTLATTGKYRVIVEIDEVDVARVAPGQVGRLALSSLPWDREDVVVERIAPMAKAVDGRNVFEVEARLAVPRADLRPGLLGRAELVAGRMPPLWAWTRHAVERIRIAYWSWLG